MRSLIKKVIHITKSSAVIGPYSQAVLIDMTLYISGQIGLDLSGQLVPGGVAAEAK